VSDDSAHRKPARPEGGRPRWTLLAGIAAGVLALDQLSKWWAVNTLDTRTIDLVGSLRLRLTYNFGAAFSISQGRGALISLLAIAVVGVLVFSGRQATRPLAAVALGMVLGGAIGNLSDRAFRQGDGLLGGGVVDFIDLQWWPIFNVADSAVVCGALLLVAATWRDEAREGDDRPDGDAGDAEDGQARTDDGSQADGSQADGSVEAGTASGTSSPDRR
jgi:signal peptidase II